MEIFVTVIHMAVALFMILVVLVQGGNQGGIGAAFGGGNTQGVFGAGGATTFLGKLTYGAALIFMLTSISLTILQGAGGDVGLSEKLKQQSQVDKQKDEGTSEQVPADAAAAGDEAQPAQEGEAAQPTEEPAVQGQEAEEKEAQPETEEETQ